MTTPRPLKVISRQMEARGVRYTTHWIEGTDTDGNRIRKQIQDQDEAFRWARNKEAEMQGAGLLRVTSTRLTEDQILEAEMAFKQLEGRAALNEVVNFYVLHHIGIENGRDLRSAIWDYLEARESDVRPRTYSQFKSSLFQFQRFIGGDVRVNEVTALMAEQWLDHQAKHPKIFNNLRADLHAFYEFAVDRRRQWAVTNPFAPIKRKKVGRRAVTTLDNGECKRQLKVVAKFKGGKLGRYWVLALFSGMRDGELQRIKDEDIDLLRGIIHVQPEVSKTHSYRQVVIRDNLRKWMEHFPGPIVLDQEFPKDIGALRKELGINSRSNKDVLRHTWFSNHVAAFRSVGDAAIEGGNTESILKKHYLNLRTQGEGLAFWEIGPSILDEVEEKKPFVERSRASAALFSRCVWVVLDKWVASEEATR